ncbi:UNVERIFIED_CONTAM: hypothetical protein HHA_454270 [Hammondia hammondi]|eukprot:XP_008887693.1 hypothetical protein HHA_454270 [Hammondia hammondi]
MTSSSAASTPPWDAYTAAPAPPAMSNTPPTTPPAIAATGTPSSSSFSVSSSGAGVSSSGAGVSSSGAGLLFRDLLLRNMFSFRDLLLRNMFFFRDLLLRSMFSLRDLFLRNMFSLRDLLRNMNMFAFRDLLLRNMFSLRDLLLRNMFAFRDLLLRNMFAFRDLLLRWNKLTLTKTAFVGRQDLAFFRGEVFAFFLTFSTGSNGFTEFFFNLWGGIAADLGLDTCAVHGDQSPKAGQDSSAETYQGKPSCIQRRRVLRANTLVTCALRREACILYPGA